MNVIQEDKSKICFSHIDTQIENYLKKDKDINYIKTELENKIVRFENMLKEISEGQPRYYFLKTHNCVCKKRIEDFELIERIESKFNLDLLKMFHLIKLRDRILNQTRCN